jgi:translation initiation factor IF-2
MKDEFPDAIEQATPASTRQKSTARSARSEGATPGNTEQAVKGTASRRRSSPTQSTAEVRAEPAGLHADHVEPHTDQPRPRTDHTSASPRPTVSRPTGTASTGQRATTNGSGANTQGQRPERPGGTAGQYPRASNSVAAPSPSGTRPAPAYRSGNNSPQTQKQYHSANPPGAPTHPGQQGGNTPMQQRQGQRTGGPSHGSSRPGNGGHGSVSRPTNRPMTNGARTQERRSAAVREKATGPVSIPPQIIVKDLAELLHSTPNEIIKTLIKHGIFASINEVVEYEKAAIVAQELGFEPSPSALTQASAVQGRLSANEEMIAHRDDDNTVTIPPVITIMGHVDHGKTSLLDTIRKTKVAAGEAGGITQHIGAYQVEVHGKKITFLDTPGHEAFTAMRARGAQVTHIIIIVVAADDGVMPQTREAISHAQAAKVPIIIAINKIDKDNANPDHVKQQLAEMGVVIEEYGGDVVCVPISARKGTGIDELLEMILLVAELQDIRANPNLPAVGSIIEARLEKSSGPMATVLVQQGTLKMGDSFVVGTLAGKVRAMFNDRGKRIQKATPSTPVSIIGLPEVPQAGDRLEVVADERTAKQLALQEAERRRNETVPLGQVSLDTLYMQMQEGKVKELNVVLKSDVQGSSEAIKNSLAKVGEENIKVRLIHEGIGNISETDVHLAAASGAIIIGFNVKADGAALRQAQKEGVDIRYYDVIYKLIDDIQAALTGMLEPTYREVIDAHAEVIQIFRAGKTTIIAGCRVTDGKFIRSAQVRVLRKNTKIFDGKVASLRRGKDDVREVLSGYECGIVLEDFNEFEIGDILEAYSQERVKPGA